MNEKKKKRYKRYLKINLISLLFIVVSFSSLTLAWFAYSGLTNTSMDIDVKGWYIELERGGKKSTNKIEVSLPEIYPGMDTVVEKVRRSIIMIIICFNLFIFPPFTAVFLLLVLIMLK